jgi:pimeloyl-ACP methyl ester carboxylesterase
MTSWIRRPAGLHPCSYLFILILAFGTGCASRVAPGPVGATSAPSPRAAASGWIEGPQGRLYVDDGGKGGLPVLFVHGLGGDHDVWAEQLEHLRASRRAVAMDLRGHGLSDPPRNGDYALSEMAQDVLAVARSLGLNRFVLVGHSLGGSVVIAAAAQAPAQVAGLLLADPNGDWTAVPRQQVESFREQFEGDTYTRNVTRWLEAILAKARPGVRAQVMKTFLKTPQEAVTKCLGALATYSPTKDLETYAGPKLDVITDENNTAQSLQNMTSGLRTVTIPGVSHWLMMDDPSGFDAALDEFLASIH